MEVFDSVFDEIPVLLSTCKHWQHQDMALLNSAAEKIRAHGASPWVFIADRQHFAQFAQAADYAALSALTEAEAKALLDWSEEDLPK